MTGSVRSRPGVGVVRRSTEPQGLVAVLVFGALSGATVSGFGNPLVPEVATVEDVSLEAAQWALTITLIVGAVVTPIMSRIGDGAWLRRMLVLALCIVALGSATAAVAPSFEGLLAGRALQGFGYALVPLTIAVASEHLEGPRLRRTLAWLSLSIAIGVGLANPIIGVFVYVWDYRAAFACAAMVAAAGAVVNARLLPRTNVTAGRLGVDVAGAVLLSLGLGAGLLAVSRGVAWGWTSPAILGLLVGSALSLVGFVLVELRVAAPIVDVRLASRSDLFGVNVTAFCSGAAVFGGMSLVYRVIQAPRDAPSGMGQPLLVAGLLMIPLALGSLLSPSLTRFLSRWLGPRALIASASVLSGVAFVAFAVGHTSLVQVAVVTFLVGVGVGIAYSVMPAVIVAVTPPERTSSATGLNTVLRITGGAIGGAVIAALLAAATPVGQRFPTEQGIVVTLLAAAGLCLMATLASLTVVPSMPDRVQARDHGIPTPLSAP